MKPEFKGTEKSEAFKKAYNALVEAENTAVHASLTAILLRRGIPLEDGSERVVRHTAEDSKSCTYYLDGNDGHNGEEILHMSRYADGTKVCFDISCYDENDAAVVALAADSLAGATGGGNE